MNAPINRDKQIELMTTAKDRREAKMRAWMNVPAIREIVRRPAPGQADADGYTQHVERRRLA